tara:strand:+ start:249 stop:854 length:606 start_codon:yes stop_codon:yes gene_type:complete
MNQNADTLASRLDTFRTEVARLDNTAIIDRFLNTEAPVCISREQETALKRALANNYRIEARDVLMVGSGKLGFTLVSKPQRPQFSHFSDQSDIDVALISKSLFEQYWTAAFEYHAANGPWDEFSSFRKYVFKGWIRPDMLPTSEDFPLFKEWVEFFQELQASGKYGGYKIAAGIYHSEFFCNQYIGKALNACRSAIQGQGL